MRFVKTVRLDAAREHMIAEDIRVQEAAARVGYESVSHFTRDFKTAYGASPAEYVRRVRHFEGIYRDRPDAAKRP